MNNVLKEKIESWSLGKTNGKLIPRGGEILKSIGSEMLLVKFKKENDNWSADNPLPIFVQSIGEYNPLTGTYEITYTNRDKETSTERITPEGFSFNDPETEGWMHRFITYSLHFKIMEEELYYTRLREKFDRSENVLPIESIIVLQGGKQKESLGYHNYIAAIIDTDVEGGLGEGILSFRISEITKISKRSKSWSFGLRDLEGYFIQIPKYQEVDGTWIAKGISIDGVVLGDLKIVDIEDPKKPSNP